eukprot:CAMPEP_0117564354 /NCGR_PEP_ID=MMETSP0784-20121206/55984_1 /TAXON_ID=39447 /ORGANISM="" /LENGTH=877 /DNA_ID=CAMNT_0005362063 /DNA_START=24 /DNA_END=2657 /DNA_ORIENTATION=-
MTDITPASLLNRFCQHEKTKPVYEFQPVVGPNPKVAAQGWFCRVTVDCVAFDGTATERTKKEAQQVAVFNFVQALQASGVGKALPLSKNAFKRGRETSPLDFQCLNAPLKRQFTAANPAPEEEPSPVVQTKKGTPKVLPPIVQPGLVTRPAGMTPLIPEYNAQAEVSMMLDKLRKCQPDLALEVMTTRLHGKYRSVTLKQLASLLGSIGARTPEESAHTFVFDEDLVSFLDKPSANYFGRFARWALMEFLAEGRASLRSAHLPIPVLETNGTCIPKLIAQPNEKGGCELSLVSETFLPPGNTFQKGDWLFLTFPHYERVGELYPSTCFEAELIEFLKTGEQGIHVKIAGTSPDQVHKLWGSTCRVDKAANRITYNRQIDALREVCDVPGELVWLRALLLAGDEPDVLVSHGVERELCKHAQPCPISDHMPPMAKANDSQKEALRTAMNRRMTLIQGPPGSGKTFTAVLLLRLWVALKRGPVLATAESNVAVDNIASGCARAGLDVVRVGRPEAVRPDLEQYNLQEKARSAGWSNYNRSNWAGEKDVVTRAQVVCCTCSGADSPVLQNMRFQGILIDEAAQATELAVVVPLLHLTATGSAVLVGDHAQLPPTIVSLEAEQEGFGTPLFERLVARGVEPMLLDIQYRMHPAIAAFPSSAFYGGRLRSGITGHTRPTPAGMPNPARGVPIAFVHVDGFEAKVGHSYVNEAEARSVAGILREVINAGDLMPHDIGVITPYTSQTRLIRQHCGQRHFVDGKTGAMQTEISSVDGFQGREKEMIIVSTVRANPKQSIGFLSDPRRLNVSLTRARRGLVVVGHFPTLVGVEPWGPWIKWARDRGLVLGLPAGSPEAAFALSALGSLDERQLLSVGQGAKIPGMD